MNLQATGRPPLIVEALEDEETTAERHRPAGHGQGRSRSAVGVPRDRARVARNDKGEPRARWTSPWATRSSSPSTAGTEIKLGADEVLVLRASRTCWRRSPPSRSKSSKKKGDGRRLRLGARLKED